MKKTKRILSVFLAAIMVISALPFSVTASAETTLNVGDVIEFGRYNRSGIKNENDEITGFVSEPIKWRVLNVIDGKALVFSDEIIDAKKYNSTSATVDGYYGNNYAQSDIRKWLINDFYNSAFTFSEKNMILSTTLDNSACATDYNASGSYTKYSSESTTDKVFLLSKDEANKYASKYFDAAGTDYAYANGYKLYSGAGSTVGARWLLRTAGNNTFQIYYVHIRWGKLTTYFNWDDDSITAKMGVRPAMYIDIDAYIRNANNEITIPDDAIEYNGHSYSLISEIISWDQAKEYCERVGGHLATITSAAENNAITSMLSAKDSAYWIGAECTNGEWKWITDETWEFTNWGKGEPAFMDKDHLCARINCETTFSIEMRGYEFNYGDWDACQHFDAYKHTIPMGGFICEWDNDSKLDYHVTFGNSTEYISEISCISADLSEAAYGSTDYDSSVLIKKYEEYGFNVEDDDYFSLYDYEDNYNPYRSGCAVGFKKSVYSDDMICLITVRGSVGSKVTGSDWHGNYSILTNTEGKHIGFANPAMQIYKYINEMISNLNITGNVKYVITGHSRGAGVANLLSVELMEKGVSADDIYNYNFACPDVACRYFFTDYKNIFNICNRLDIVPHIPGRIASIFTSTGTSWEKFGVTYWFTKDAEDKHAISLYREFVYNNPDMPNLDKSEGDIEFDKDMYVLGWITKVFCPVDVILTDVNNNRIASVINGEVDYYESNYDDLIILTDGDKKVIFSTGERDFNVELIATGTGKMTYSVEKYNLETGESLEAKTFTDVGLYNGKKMNSPVYQAETTDKIELYVVQNVDDESILSHAVNTDGTEIELVHIDINKDNLCDNCGEMLNQEVDPNCNHICHTDNEFLKFIWTIFNFLMKLFSMERICTCGAAHY